MCAALAPRAALGFGATAAASTACAGMARRGMEPSVPAQKRARHGMIGGGEREAPAPAAQRLLEERMEVELAAVLVLLRKAERLSRDTGKEAPRVLAAGPRPEEDPGKATRKRKTPPSKKPAPEAAAAAVKKSKEPEKKPQDKRATVTPPPPPPPPTRKTSMGHLLAEAAKEARARRRREEIARERAKFRQELLEMERAVLPDETIHPRDLAALGIVAEYAVTPTKMQAQRRHRQAIDAAAAAATTFAAVCPSNAP
ncbi:hypothetical protein ACP4OV_008524 [Aristida adscensionis]